jgi:hypothetical protein
MEETTGNSAPRGEPGPGALAPRPRTRSARYIPQPGHGVIIRRYDVPCPELPGAAERELLTGYEGTVTAVRGTGFPVGDVLLTLDGTGEPVFTGDQFNGQDTAGVGWTLRTGVTRTASPLMARSRAAWERLVREWDHAPGDPVPAAVRLAEEQVDVLKAVLGEPGSSDPLCCRRYSRLHAPVFSVAGCRWLGEPETESVTS